MKIEKIKDDLFRITPDADKHLTQSALGEEETRVFCSSAYELSEDDASKWVEWTEEQKQEWDDARQPEPPMFNA